MRKEKKSKIKWSKTVPVVTCNEFDLCVLELGGELATRKLIRLQGITACSYVHQILQTLAY